MNTVYPANGRVPIGIKVVGGNISGGNLSMTLATSATFFQTVAGLYADFPAYFSSYIKSSIDRAALAVLNTVRSWWVGLQALLAARAVGKTDVYE